MPVGTDQNQQNDRGVLLVLGGVVRIERGLIRDLAHFGYRGRGAGVLVLAAWATKAALVMSMAMARKPIWRLKVPGRGRWIMFNRSFNCGGVSHGMNIGMASTPVLCSKVCA